MIPTLVPKPFHRDGWVYEEKVDGYRMLAYKEGPHVRLVSRHGIDHAHRYPLVMAAVASLPAKTLVVDAELAVFDQQLRSRFDWLRHRQPAEVATPPVLIAFDVLYLKGRDLTKRPLRERRPRLEALLADADLVHPVRRLAPSSFRHGRSDAATASRRAPSSATWPSALLIASSSRRTETRST